MTDNNTPEANPFAEDTHANYPHEPGFLYDCFACEVNHYEEDDVHCVMLDERLGAHATPNRGDQAHWRCRCGAAIAVADEPEHFANVIHAWDDIPRYLRGLRDPDSGRTPEDVIHEIMMDAEIHGPEVRASDQAKTGLQSGRERRA